MTCRFEDLGACAPILGKRVTFGAAASLMATLVVASVGLLFSVPGSAAHINADQADAAHVAIVAASEAAGGYVTTVVDLSRFAGSSGTTTRGHFDFAADVARVVLKF